MHGFNRLGGNSVAETVVAGMIVGTPWRISATPWAVSSACPAPW